MAELQKIKMVAETQELFSHLSAQAPKDMQLYNCPLCRDNGWLITEAGALPCSCTKQSRLLKQRREAGIMPAMDEMRFANFDFDYYTAQRQLKPGCTYRQAAEKAVKAAKVFVAAVCNGENPRGLYFDGSLGSGKTFLAASIANELVEKHVNVRFIVVPEFLEQLRLSYRDNTEENEAQIMRDALNARVLILDDLGAHNCSQWTISKIYTLLNHRLNSCLPCVITTNLKPASLGEELGARAASRIREICDRYIILTDEDIRGKKRSGGGWQL